MKFIRVFLLLMVLSVVCVGVGSATITLNDGSQLIVLTDETISLQGLYNYILSVKGESSTHSLYIEQNNASVGGHWNVKCRIESGGGGYLTMNATDETVYFSALDEGGTFLCGAIWEDVIIRSWSNTALEPGPWETRLHRYTSHSYFNNVTWDTAGPTHFGDSTHYRDNITIINCSNTGWYTYTNMYGYNFTVDGYDMIDSYVNWEAGRAGIIAVVYNSSFTNMEINPFKTFERPVQDSTGSYGFQLSGNYNHLENIHVENTSYSGYNLNGNYHSFINCSAHNTNHNQFEACTRDSYYENITITGGNSSKTYHQWFTSMDSGSSNVTVDGLNITGTIGNGEGMRLLGYDNQPLSNYHFKNINLGTKAIVAGGVQDSIFENVSSQRTGNYNIFSFSHDATGPNSKNITIIDSNFTSTLGGYFGLLKCDARLINTNFVETQAGSEAPWNITTYYPINVHVMNTTGYSVNNALISISSNYSSVDRNGTTKTTAYTDSSGKLDASSMIYVPDYYWNESGHIYDVLNISATKFGEIDYESGVDADITWRSTDIDNPNGTLITLILDVDGVGEPLSISSFIPTDTVLLSTVQTFSIDLTNTANVTWIIDGVPMQTNTSVTSASYTNSTAPAGTYNVTAIADDGSTEVSQTWIWTVEEEPVTPTDDWYTNSKTSMIDDIDSSLQLAGVILIVLGGVVILGILAAVMKYELDTTVAIGAIVLIIISGAVLIIGLMMISGMVDAMP